MNSDTDKEAKRNEKKDSWDKLKAIGPLLVALAVSVVGGWFNLQQATLERETREQQASLERETRKQQASLEREAHRREVFTELVAQREKADSDLRAATFETLFQAYFGGEMSKSRDVPQPENPGERLDQEDVRRQIMFLHLLALNFETIDIKPLFEDLDARLTRIFEDNEDERRLAFRLREDLRKVGRSLGGRQLRALASLEETQSQRLIVENCGEKPRIIDLGENEHLKGKVIDILTVEDGHVRIAFGSRGMGRGIELEEPLRFGVSFFDMPYIDNSRIASDVRLAIVLDRYLSPTKYGPFLEPGDDLYTEHQLLEKNRECDQAVLWLLQFPEDYMGLRDRPYVEDIILNIMNKGY